MTAPLRRLRFTVPIEPPSIGAPEGVKAAWFREQRLRMSRPELAERLKLHPDTIVRYEDGRSVIPETYRLACAALSASIAFDWIEVRIPVPAGAFVAGALEQ